MYKKSYDGHKGSWTVQFIVCTPLATEMVAKKNRSREYFFDQPQGKEHPTPQINSRPAGPHINFPRVHCGGIKTENFHSCQMLIFS